ncbi:acyltransferase family protein [Candidatus Contendibacter odensensis]|nr:acyltransferase [Candidatus Contendobacter odensis]
MLYSPETMGARIQGNGRKIAAIVAIVVKKARDGSMLSCQGFAACAGLGFPGWHAVLSTRARVTLNSRPSSVEDVRMTQRRSKLGYVSELDGLRGAAILGVMGFHADTPFLKGCFIGVDIFFVLSGFLITTLLIQEFDESGSVSLKNFYMRRVLRLGPALIALLIVFCLASFAVLSEEKASRNYVDVIISLAYLSNWARAFSIHPPDFLGHTWSLSIEEQFYIAWPIILLTILRVSKKRPHVVIIAATIALLSWIFRVYLSINSAPPERLYNGLDTRADTLMVGCTLGLWLSSGLATEKAKKILQKHLVVIAPISMVFLLAVSTLSYWRDPWMYYFGFVIVELLTTALVLDVLINPQSIIRKVLAMKWLVWVGSISYGLYLWHYPIYRTMSALGFYRLDIITVGSLVTFIVAVFSYYVMERPLLKLKKRFTSERYQRG